VKNKLQAKELAKVEDVEPPQYGTKAGMPNPVIIVASMLLK
jgi:hypothetical protein